MTLYALKPAFQTRLRPLARALAASGLTANQITVATAVLSIGVGITVMLNAAAPAFFLLIPLALGLRIPLNAVDGLMARECRQSTRLGAYLNELGDVVSDTALMLPFAFVPPLSPASVGVLIFLTVLAEYAGVLGLGFCGERQYQGPLGKSDRALVLALLGFWIGIGQVLPERTLLGVPVAAALLIATLIQRVRAGLGAAGPDPS